ncbi:hypothetical protein [Paraburkholderia graminis]|uniref:hypothetical protein n=1 Tax=Paraburkholderia graminis TaxID=60548 RepID=UPI00286BA6C8|nr:hypothetical protein [Paraburkholderia graminis]
MERTVAVHDLAGEVVICPGQKAKRYSPGLMSAVDLTSTRSGHVHSSDVSLRHMASDANTRDECDNPDNSPIAETRGGKYRLVNAQHRDTHKHCTLQNHRPDGGRFQIRAGDGHNISIQGGLVIVAHSKTCWNIWSYSDPAS